jgi:hypothetical protein
MNKPKHTSNLFISLQKIMFCGSGQNNVGKYWLRIYLCNIMPAL